MLPLGKAGRTYQNSNYEGKWTYGSSIKQGMKMKAKTYGYVRALDSGTSTYKQDRFKNIATHELGHALGWFGHSNTKGDIMYVKNLDDGTPTALVTAEKNHLRQAYLLSNLP